MANEAANSSWHPALMPDKDDSLEEVATHLTSQPEQDASTSQKASNTDQEQPNDSFRSWEVASVADGGDAWPTQDGHDGGGAWLESEDSINLLTQPAAETAEAQDTFSIEDETDATSSPTKANHAQHASSMSFARTVSHEPNFNDDDDADWNLTRTETDPFQAMPPSSRTNTFPVVPPVEPPAAHEAPLPAGQVEDIMEEIARDSEDGDELPAALPQQPSKGRHVSSGSMGGDAQVLEENNAGNRYEEGVPLLPHTEESNVAAPETSAYDSRIASTFADEDGQEDNFFSKMQSSEPGDHDYDMPSLQRKSTSQVIGDSGVNSLSRQGTLHELQEEDEDLEDGGADSKEDDQARVEGEDLSAKWQAAFGDDDDDGDFLLEDNGKDPEVDAAAFLGSDDEGMLDEPEGPVSLGPPQPEARQNSNPYVPQTASTPAPSQPYTPSMTPQAQQPPAYQPSGQPQRPGPAVYGQPTPPQTDASRAQSFANQSKGGYASPYDLPTDLVSNVKPRKRASMQQMASAPSTLPPSRSASSVMSAPPTSSISPPSSSHGAPLNPKPSSSTLKQGSSSFFEDLPMSSKPRPTSRQSHRAPSPSRAPPPSQPPPGPSPLAHAQVSYAQPPQPPPAQASSATMNLVAPDRVSPYAALQSAAPPAPISSQTARYSQSPNGAPIHPGMTSPVANTRYSPAPTQSRSSSSYSPTGPNAVSTPQTLPHQPRTSSPLAHFETHATREGALLDRRASSSSYEPRLNRVPSLPPTREVVEEDDQISTNASIAARQAPSASETRYSPAPPVGTRQTPPPPHGSAGMAASPRHTASTYAPPPPSTLHRAQTQPQGFTHNATLQRSASAQPHQSLTPTKATQPSFAPTARAHRPSMVMDCVPPTDGREHDPLERWKGVPIISWGMGGTIVTSFPKSIPRYGMNSSAPTTVRTNGEVKIGSIKDLEPLQERLTKFPGPLKGKVKKKETLAWLTAGIDTLQKEVPDVAFHAELSLEAKRAVERTLLWKILRVFIEHDGVLEGNAAVERAVRDVLAPGSTGALPNGDSDLPRTLGSQVASVQADSVDLATIEQIRHHLMKGERESAAWVAVDKRLWGHAMLIANTVGSELYKQVAQEFVRKEVNHPGSSNEPIAALYKIFSGNLEDSVDELVPAHARAGLQLISTHTAAGGPTKDAIEGLDKWQETLTLVLSNRSPNDIQGLKALGNLLSSYGRAEAAHVCFLFARQACVFGGLSEPNADMVLVGSDHRQQSDQFAKETEALQLSEVYEYGLSLAGGQHAAAGAPHLAAYKLQHAITLAEYGYRDKAMQYCDAIAAAMSAQTKRSPYYHSLLEAAVLDFGTRLKQAPKGESAGWMSKPSMGKVSDSMWNRFNKFVAGDENENASKGAAGESGPFGHITPTNLSRSPSINNFEMYGQQAPAYSVAPTLAPPSSSKYAPMAPQTAPNSNPYAPVTAPADTPPVSNTYGPAYSTQPAPFALNGGNVLSPSSGNDGIGRPSQLPQTYGLMDSPDLQPSQGGVKLEEVPTQGYQPSSYGYEPSQMNFNSSPPEEGNTQQEQTQSSGFEPPSFQPYGYEPPSYDPQPDAEGGGEAPEPKKKSFMDDDEDDIPALRQPQEKSKSEKDRENEEMFRKAAEEDAKRAAAAQQGKKGWGFGGWFAGKRAESPAPPDGSPNKPIKAKLGEASSFVYDPDLKRWVNKKSGAENTEVKAAAPPPPRAGPRSVSGTPPPPSMGGPPPPGGRSSVPPPMPVPPALRAAQSMNNLNTPSPTMARSVSNGSTAGDSVPPPGPPSRPATSMSNASSIDDLLQAAPAGGRRAGGKKPRKSGRYVDVMAQGGT